MEIDLLFMVGYTTESRRPEKDLHRSIIPCKYNNFIFNFLFFLRKTHKNKYEIHLISTLNMNRLQLRLMNRWHFHMQCWLLSSDFYRSTFELLQLSFLHQSRIIKYSFFVLYPFQISKQLCISFRTNRAGSLQTQLSLCPVTFDIL